MKNGGRFALDKNRLDDHWLTQTELRSAASRKREKAELEVARAKSVLDLAKAELELEIREDPSKFGIAPKAIREQTIKALVITQPRYQKALRRLNRKKYLLGIYDSDVKSYEHRKKALENLVVLWKGDYFGRPSIPEDLDDETKEVMRAKRTRAAMKHSRLKRKKRKGDKRVPL